MSKKYYAVRVGRKAGIYDNWADAKDQVHGYKNAIYRSFNNLQDAEAFMNPEAKQDVHHIEDPDTVIAYVDGSFQKSTMRYSFGAVLLQNDQVIETLSRVGDNPKYQGSWQIAGEVFGALHAIKWAIDNNFKKIIIHYDYVGIKHWALGEWRANKPVSIDYAEAYQNLASQIDVDFVKVKAHSGVKYNEMVDQIAKDALNDTPANELNL